MAPAILAGRWNMHRLTATVINGAFCCLVVCFAEAGMSDIAVEVVFFTLWSLGMSQLFDIIAYF